MITLTTEQAQQIEEIVEHLLVEHPTARHHKACVEALSIIRAARAQEQAEQEPVGYFAYDEEQQCWDQVIGKNSDDAVALYAAPVRTKDLTDDEITNEWESMGRGLGKYTEFARAVIAKDREKNNANNNS